MNKERLLNVAKALRESPKPDHFTMSRYADCGTPACAFGHYAARTDLQSAFIFDPQRGGDYMPVRNARHPEESVNHGCDLVRIHFDITDAEASRLFGCESEAEDLIENGAPESAFLCMCCGSANEAADWIERFVAEHE